MTPDTDGFTDFVAARSTSLLRTAYLTCGSVQEAEDLLQTALERACLRWDRLCRGGDPEPYIRRIIVNLAISRWRRLAVMRFIPMHTPPEQPAAREDIELRHVVMDALRALPPRQRAVVVLRIWDDMTEAQTAKMLGCSVGTVKSQTSKALKRLRALLGEEVASSARH
ncbi:SigE family RNA polymerase sigma factor [Sphaerisporangium krabiense]|uniref:RNA polymerase sigma-70 factor (Sigma-E family) n=1 Tax=Sphaerisporangium krabiense TaxID=763782 RepID=A0A7W8Z3S0_9ACTN|nr:SigE family RNA polymerase sigma factor [Sphaerisporangium krabiense]MBB5626876.1 RNA polymerase sigma-70 factor (sigma-E family) [Sphaerisporangium krabiense]